MIPILTLSFFIFFFRLDNENIEEDSDCDTKFSHHENETKIDDRIANAISRTEFDVFEQKT